MQRIICCCQWSQITSLASCSCMGFLKAQCLAHCCFYIIYINDVTCVVSNGKMVVYAEDIALPVSWVYDINAVSEWITANYLALNYRKCCHLLFLHKRSPTLPVAPLEVNGNFVKQVNEYKYLGVILTSDMSWSSHISAISSKTRKLIGVQFIKSSISILDHIPSYVCTSHGFVHTLNMLVVFGILTWRKTLRGLRVFRSLGWKFV